MADFTNPHRRSSKGWVFAVLALAALLVLLVFAGGAGGPAGGPVVTGEQPAAPAADPAPAD
jgi:hypothetical protein